MAAKVLVSACLLGARVRYDGRARAVDDDVVRRWLAEDRVVSVCPEVAGGLAVPRAAAEIAGGGGADVLDGHATVRTINDDVTEAFVRGAEYALAVATQAGVRVAVLKERSPSCGGRQIYDGTHAAILRKGEGVTAALLRRHGIAVYGESELADADAHLVRLDAEL